MITNSNLNKSEYEINEIYNNINLEVDNEILELSKNNNEKFNISSSNTDNKINNNSLNLNNIIAGEFKENSNNEKLSWITMALKMLKI